MSANERQVGGAHYMQGYQHWDMAADFQLGYFPGQITKYITRHRKKNKFQDVQKAMHFLDKWEECIKEGTLPSVETMPRVPQALRLLDLYAKDRELNAAEENVILMCCTVRGAKCIPGVRDLIQALLDEYNVQKVEVTSLNDAERKFVEVPQDPEPAYGGPGPGYVNQDR